MHSPRPKMFMNWKVPTRLTDDGCSEKALTPERAVTSLSLGRKSNRSAIPSATGALRRENTMPALPQISSAAPRLESRPATNQRMSRASMRGSVRGMAPPQTEAPPCSPVREEPRVPATPKPTKVSKGPKGYRSNELLKTYYQPPSTDQLEELLAKATDSEKKMIEQALKLTAMGSMKTQPGKSLESWLHSAGPKDREVALNFFKTLVKSKIIDGGADHQQKIRALQSELERNSVNDPSLPYSSDPIEEDRFRYIRILTPKTRRNKWMHQTWHHLPSYHDNNPVTNRSAIYTEPHKIMPRHFTIHPDWGI